MDLRFSSVAPGPPGSALPLYIFALIKFCARAAVSMATLMRSVGNYYNTLHTSPNWVLYDSDTCFFTCLLNSPYIFITIQICCLLWLNDVMFYLFIKHLFLASNYDDNLYHFYFVLIKIPAKFSAYSYFYQLWDVF